MPQAPIPHNEQERLAALHALELLDTAPDAEFDRITRLIARTLDVPIALISLVDTHRQWFKSRVGLDTSETPRDWAFCAHAVHQDAPLVVRDAHADPRFADNPLVTGDPNIRFYAGVPIRSTAGFALGTLCAIDRAPREISEADLAILTDLAALVSKDIQQREAASLARRNITQAAADIESKEALFSKVFELADVGIAMVAPDGTWLRVNDALCDIVGYTQAELAELTFQDITHPDDLNKDLNLLKQLVAGEIDRYRMEKRYWRKGGALTWVHLSVTKKVDQAGQLEYFVSIVEDIQARKEAEESLAALRRDLEERVAERTQELRTVNEMLSFSMTQQVNFERALLKREAELSAVIENANDAYVCIDQAGVVTAWNRQASETFGWSAQEAIGTLLENLIVPPHMQDAHRAGMKRFLSSGESNVINQRIELQAIRRDGTPLPVEVRIKAIEVNGQTVFSGFLHDITERKQAEAAREYEARHDALTGLPNRRAFFELLPGAIARTRRSKKAMAVLFIDLDGFKLVNDSYGHEAGDQLLRELALRLARNVRQTDTAARLAGDEFTVLLEGLSQDAEDAQEIARKLLGELCLPVSVGEQSVAVTASIGIAMHRPEDTQSPDDLLKLADTAMYRAKGLGKSCIVLS